MLSRSSPKPCRVSTRGRGLVPSPSAGATSLYRRLPPALGMVPSVVVANAASGASQPDDGRAAGFGAATGAAAAVAGASVDSAVPDPHPAMTTTIAQPT